MKRMRIFQALAAGAMLFLAQGAQASLVFDAAIDQQGQGFGAVVNILTFGSLGGPGNSNDGITGGIRWTGSADQQYSENPSGVVQMLDHKSATHTFGSLGITAASEIGLFWNPAEQGGAQQTVVKLAVLNIYSATGVLVWSSGGNLNETSDPGFTETTFPTTVNNGVGGVGWGFRLDAPQAALLQAVLNAAPGGDFSLYRIGMYAEVDDLDDGPDTWNLAKLPAQVPEPGPLALMALGLLGLGFASRRRKA